MARNLFIDFETTGLNRFSDRPVSVGARLFDTTTNKSIDFYSLIHPGYIPSDTGDIVSVDFLGRTERTGNKVFSIPSESTAIHGITNEMVSNAPSMESVFGQLNILARQADRVIAHNAPFDISIWSSNAQKVGVPIPGDLPITDTAQVARDIFHRQSSFPFMNESFSPTGPITNKLEDIASYYNIPYKSHNALEDVIALQQVYSKLPTSSVGNTPWVSPIGNDINIPIETVSNRQYKFPFASSYISALGKEEIPPIIPKKIVSPVIERSSQFLTTEKGLWKKIGIGAGVLVGAGILYNNLFSGKDDSYNTVEGLPHGGMAEQGRHTFTDFGSGYRGIQVHGQWIAPEITAFRNKWFVSPETEAELHRKQQIPNPYGTFNTNQLTDIGNNRARVDISGYTPEWEDADTLLLKSTFRKDIAIRLAGIDAPEIAHPGDPTEWFRFHQTQPHGQESLEQVNELTRGQDLSLTISTDPSQQSYGRYIGVVGRSGSNKSINEELVAQGIAAQLPFGPSRSDMIARQSLAKMEKQARISQTGMWQEQYFQKYYAISQVAHKRTTFTSFTDLSRLAKNYNLAAAQNYMEDPTQTSPAIGRKIGSHLRSIYKKPKIPSLAEPYENIEGMRHGGLASILRKITTAFGSKYDILRDIAKSLGKTFEQVISSPEWKEALGKATVVKKLGKGAFGQTEHLQTTFMGREINLVKKTPFVEKRAELLKEGWQPEVLDTALDPKYEGEFNRLLGETESVPSLYGYGKESLYMEYMPGKPLAELFGTGPVRINEEARQSLFNTIEEVHKQGIYNPDIHRNNLMFDPETGRVFWLDFGLAKRNQNPLSKIDMQLRMTANIGPGKRSLHASNNMAVNNPIGSSAPTGGPRRSMEFVEVRGGSSTPVRNSQILEEKSIINSIHNSQIMVSHTNKMKKVIISDAFRSTQRDLAELSRSGGHGHYNRRANIMGNNIRIGHNKYFVK